MSIEPGGPTAAAGAKANPLDDQIAFIDFEASGLGVGSWPIEVGWGAPGAEAQSLLIAPAPGWSMAAWDPHAEQLHGLSVSTLTKLGSPAGEVCQALNTALDGRDVYSDAPDYDATWLGVLYQTGCVRPSFRICDIRDLILPIAPYDCIAEIMDKANALQPHTHRAAQDVRNLQTIYALCRAAAP